MYVRVYTHIYGTAQMQCSVCLTWLLVCTVLASLHVRTCFALMSLHVYACLVLASLHVRVCLVCASLHMHVYFLHTRLRELNDNSLYTPDTFKTAMFINSLIERVI